MGNCGCNHCDCEEEKEDDVCECDETCDCAHDDKSTEEKVSAFKKAIGDLGYGVEETEEGIRIHE